MLKCVRALFVVFFCCLTAVAATAAEQSVKAVEFSPSGDHSRLVLSLSAQVKYTTTVLASPDRLVVDLRDVRLRADLKAVNLQDTPVTHLRSAVRNQTNLRLVLDLDSSVKAQSSWLKADKNQGDCLVIELSRRGAAPTRGEASKGGASSKAASVVVADKPDAGAVVASTSERKVVKSANSSDRRDIIIAIDAGHGGDDPGASGPGHLKEKQVALAIARELADLFARERGYRPVLTRSKDVFLPLKLRRDLARKAQADLMVSIHADAFNDTTAQGGSVFALSDRGATSTMAAFLANSENQADAIGGVSTEGKDDDLVKVLADLSVTATMDSSLRVGRSVLNSMGGLASLHTHRVEQAAFVVLKSPDTPSILVETGFISNPQEAKRLASHDYQQQMARAIFNGINRYFTQTPPPNTYIAWLKRGGQPQQAALSDSPAQQTVATQP